MLVRLVLSWLVIDLKKLLCADVLGKESIIPEIVVPLIPPSKWDDIDDTETKGDDEDEAREKDVRELSSLTSTKTIAPEKVTSDVIRRAEYAIFQKAANAIVAQVETSNNSAKGLSIYKHSTDKKNGKYFKFITKSTAITVI